MNANELNGNPSKEWSKDKLTTYCKHHVKMQAEHAWKIGKACIIVRDEKCKHGEFTPWKKKFCEELGIGESTLNRWIADAKKPLKEKKGESKKESGGDPKQMRGGDDAAEQGTSSVPVMDGNEEVPPAKDDKGNVIPVAPSDKETKLLHSELRKVIKRCVDELLIAEINRNPDNARVLLDGTLIACAVAIKQVQELLKLKKEEKVAA